MVAKDPANLRARQQLAKTYSRLGVTLANIGQRPESIRYLDQAVADSFFNDPEQTRDVLGLALAAALNAPVAERANFGVFRM